MRADIMLLCNGIMAYCKMFRIFQLSVEDANAFILSCSNGVWYPTLLLTTTSLRSETGFQLLLLYLWLFRHRSCVSVVAQTFFAYAILSVVATPVHRQIGDHR